MDLPMTPTREKRNTIPKYTDLFNEDFFTEQSLSTSENSTSKARKRKSTDAVLFSHPTKIPKLLKDATTQTISHTKNPTTTKTKQKSTLFVPKFIRNLAKLSKKKRRIGKRNKRQKILKEINFLNELITFKQRKHVEKRSNITKFCLDNWLPTISMLEHKIDFLLTYF